MHEMSLMESVIEIVCETARLNGARQVQSIRLDVGVLSHVDPDALLFCYEAVRHGTLAGRAKLEINRIAGEGWCLDCGKKVALQKRFGPCPGCGRHRIQITAGDEMKIRDMEVI
ncbi:MULTISPECIES: hydrogenase maturation nickel metallochaperone HypA [Sinorhizobium]|uniref:Hydrogenase maturation factor HypA n=1 Tax=Sinorhizobium americanum TaxID=194963 RepID=A0A2S3YT56_9HYPH|nr:MULTISPECIES: hydrogenase maturation nickel metallochaperone HypA [Sinorhizobium]PDT36631.1 hydrogenase maturation nickel metallochaperone HypA [Sinorhizobium sp. FG01]PDT49954.1 hydrogenase maturation nickel metallochaperone HypA [Sinorhizobium sp. NG07B]POH33558.1 hydrogenase nickel incorporation protein HypA [Sinorhizobium americanum]POH34775.1 hydrogenase nickel incorporation protein HypA [Sinorhizobium americanum]